MGNTKDYAQSVDVLCQKINELNEFIVHGEYNYKITSIIKNHQSLFDRFCPYKIDDMVRLTKTPKIDLDSGWHCYRHFLIEGALAKVCEADYYQDRFRFGLQFPSETWISSIDNIAHPKDPDNLSVFMFSEDFLELVTDLSIESDKPKLIESFCKILSSIGILFELSEGKFNDFDIKQCSVDILDSQGGQALVSFYFDVDRAGNQKFVCQE